MKSSRFTDWAERQAAPPAPGNRCAFCGARILPTRDTCRFCSDLPALDTFEAQEDAA